MKQTKFFARVISTAVIAVMMCISATSCTDTAQSNRLISEETTATENNIQTAVYETKLKYYEAEIEHLSQDLLNLKEEYYVGNSESRQRIENLSQKVNDLEEQLKTVSVDKIKEKAHSASTQDDYDEGDTNEKLSEEVKYTYSDYTYSETASGIRIDKYMGSDPNVFMPSYINGKKVTAIGDNAFASAKITSVTIPDTVESLGWFAFYCCSELNTVYIPGSVSSIEYGAFDYCDSKLTFHCPADSYAADYAASRAIKALY